MERNLTNLKELRQWMIDHPEHFAMESWCTTTYMGDRGLEGYQKLLYTKWTTPLCGTVMCMGGTASMLMLLKKYKEVTDEEVRDVSSVDLANWLGLTYDETTHLFYMKYNYWRRYGLLDMVHVEDAIAMLDHIIAGEICNENLWCKVAPHAIRR